MSTDETMRPHISGLDPEIVLRLQRVAERIHALGARALAEFLALIADDIGGLPVILERLTHFRQHCPPATLAVLGATRFAPRRPLLVPPPDNVA